VVAAGPLALPRSRAGSRALRRTTDVAPALRLGDAREARLDPVGERAHPLRGLPAERGEAVLHVGRGRFPASLDGAPFLLPEAQFANSALLQTFGQAGAGLFAARTAIEREIERQYGVRVAGRLPEVRQSFYAISAERRLAHPALLGLAEVARRKLVA
jgi:hypothetical protein